MKTFFYFFIFLFFIFLVGTLAIVPLVNATCSLGASPLEMTANAQPGQKVEIIWNFFNLRGDRPTHVLVNKSIGQEWKIEYEPKAEIKQYEVSGLVKAQLENFAMEKSLLVKEKPEPLPTGKLAYIVHPNSSEGYILVDKQVKISVTIPDNAKIGKQQDFVFEAIGQCFGEQGAVAASLATELKVKITPSLDYYEKPLEQEINQTAISKKIASLFSGNLNPVYMITTGTTLILIIIFIVLVILARKKVKKAIKEEIKILKPTTKRRK